MMDDKKRAWFGAFIRHCNDNRITNAGKRAEAKPHFLAGYRAGVCEGLERAAVKCDAMAVHLEDYAKSTLEIVSRKIREAKP